MEIDALIYYQIIDAAKAVYEISNVTLAIEMLTQTTLRNVLGEMELDESLTGRDRINKTLREILDEATAKWGVKVNRVEIKDIEPPPSIQEEMEKQLRAERNKRATVLEAQGMKEASILEAEGYQQSQISKADGEKQAAVLKAEGEAESISIIKKSLGVNDEDYLQYILAMKYLETMERMTSGKDNKVIYMPYEASSMLSSIASIKDLFEKGK